MTTPAVPSSNKVAFTSTGMTSDLDGLYAWASLVDQLLGAWIGEFSSSDAAIITAGQAAATTLQAGGGAASRGLNALPVGKQPANPTATTSTSLVMMGLGTSGGGNCRYTPAGTGSVGVLMYGYVNTATAAVRATVGARYGTGLGAANGAAVTGTSWSGGSGDPQVLASGATATIPAMFATVLALTPGTSYWFDLALATANGSDAASVANVGFIAVEL